MLVAKYPLSTKSWKRVGSVPTLIADESLMSALCLLLKIGAYRTCLLNDAHFSEGRVKYVCVLVILVSKTCFHVF